MVESQDNSSASSQSDKPPAPKKATSDTQSQTQETSDLVFTLDDMASEQYSENPKGIVTFTTDVTADD